MTASVAALVALTSWPPGYVPSGDPGVWPVLLPLACATSACLGLVLLAVSSVRRTPLPLLAVAGQPPKR